MKDNYETSFDNMFDYDHNGSLDSIEKCWRNDYINDLTTTSGDGGSYSSGAGASGVGSYGGGNGYQREHKSYKPRGVNFWMGLYRLGLILLIVLVSAILYLLGPVGLLIAIAILIHF